ncbi:MAG: DUF1990 family protein [Acidimicrobiia bacterium]
MTLRAREDVIVFSLRAPTEAKRSQVFARERVSPLTYSEVGATLTELPPGYHHARGTIVVGRGDDAFARARDGIRAWCPLTAAGIEVVPPNAPIEVGTTVGLVIRLGPSYVLAACRVVVVIDEPDRYGFAYGTLPSHPAVGEESFIVARDADTGAVRFDVVAFSRPHDLLTKLGGPVTRRVQARSAQNYLEGMREYVASGRG